ncbi:MAG: CAP domain-containing protein [Lachnospiraceae bacterium]|nr:CAP domain-containing protein [Lachnospiraceae bacterium]
MKKQLYILMTICMISLTLLFADSYSAEAASSYDTSAITVSGVENYTYAQEVVNLVNKTRNELGLPSLTLDAELTEAAMQRAAELSINFDHTRPDGTSCFTVLMRSYTAAENIACGQTSPESVMYSWLNSSGHYANIVSSYMTSIGVGCFRASDGEMYWVQYFDNASPTELTKTGTVSTTRTVNVLNSTLIARYANPTISELSNTSSGVKVEWDRVVGATGYIVYRKVSGGSYTRLCKITSGSTLSYTDTATTGGKTYYYKIQAYCGSGSNVTKSIYSSVKSILHLSPGEIIGLRNTTAGMKIAWSKVSGASGYYIYRKAAGGTYTKIATITSGSTTTYTDSKSAKTGTVYYYAVKPYASDGTTGSYISSKKVRLYTPTLSSVINSSSQTMTVKWTSKPNITGYQIQYSLTSDFSSSNTAKKVTGESTSSTTISGLSKGKTYYVRIRLYKTISGTNYYSDWSSVKKVVISN